MPGKTESRRSITQLQAGDFVEDEVFLLTQKDLRTTSNGGLYIHAILADRSGQILSRMWNASQAIFESMTEGKLVTVRGRVESYKGNPQFIIDGIRTADESEIDMAAFLPSTQYDVEKMWARVKEILRGVKHPQLLELVGAFINDDAFATAFKKAPAARTNHHAFLGGLLEHTLNLLELATLVLPRYPDVSPDLVLTGILLHDAGKTAEIAAEGGFNYTDEGQLLGHIVQATLWVHERARAVAAKTGKPFDRHVLMCLEHILVAHHGRYEYGSPKLPATAEAVMVHYLDNLDAKLNMVFGAIDADNDPASDWTKWVPALETRVYKPDVTRPPNS